MNQYICTVIVHYGNLVCVWIFRIGGRGDFKICIISNDLIQFRHETYCTSKKSWPISNKVLYVQERGRLVREKKVERDRGRKIYLFSPAYYCPPCHSKRSRMCYMDSLPLRPFSLILLGAQPLYLDTWSFHLYTKDVFRYAF